MKGDLVAEQVGVDDWRAGLWLQALQDQGQERVEGGQQLSQRLYTCFKSTRLQHIRLEHGVEVHAQHPTQTNLSRLVPTFQVKKRDLRLETCIGMMSMASCKKASL